MSVIETGLRFDWHATVFGGRPEPSRGAVVRHRGSEPGAADAVALVALLLLVLEVFAGVVPSEPTVWIITPLRALLVIGLIAALVAAPHRGGWATVLDLPAALLVGGALLAAWRVTGDFAPWRWLVTAVAAYYLAVAVLRRLRDRGGAAVLGAVGSAIAATAAVSEFSGQSATGFCRNPLTGSADCADPGAWIRAIGTFDNPNTLAAFLLLALPFAALFALRAQGSGQRAVGWAIVASGVAAMLFTGSRAPIVALVVGAGAYALLLRPSARALRRAGAAAGRASRCSGCSRSSLRARAACAPRCGARPSRRRSRIRSGSACSAAAR